MKNILTLLLTFHCFGTFAQVVNIENRRLLDDSSGWSGAVDASFSIARNKDLFFSGSFRPRVQFKSKKHYWLFLTDWSYSKAKNQEFANSGMAHLRYAYRIGKDKDSLHQSPWKWESYSQVQYNKLLDQKLRTLVGTGFRVKIIGHKRYRFFTGSSFFFEYEEIQSSNIINRDIRWSNYLSWTMSPNDNFSFTAATYFQPNVKDFKDYRILGQYNLYFKFFKRVDFRIDFTQYFDAKPPENVRNYVFSSSAGVHIRIGE